MVSSVSLPTQAPSASQSQSAAAPRSSFLQKCVKELSSENVAAIDRQSTLCCRWAAVTTVAYIALSVGAFAATGLFLPAYTPFIGLGVIGFAMPVATYAKKYLEYSVQSKKEADSYREMQNSFARLSKAPLLNIQHNLLSRGIRWWEIPGISFAQPDTLTRLNPLLAKATQLDTQIQRHLKSMNDCCEKIRTLSPDHRATMEGRHEIYDLRNTALFYEDRALATKIQAAFVNAVLRKADFRGTIEDIATLSIIPYNERLLGDALGQGSTVNEFLTFKNRTLTPITHDDVKRLSVAELGQRIVVAMA